VDPPLNVDADGEDYSVPGTSAAIAFEYDIGLDYDVWRWYDWLQRSAGGVPFSYEKSRQSNM